MKKIIKTPFVLPDSLIPIIEFQINGNKAHALIDTGSEATFFDSTFARDNSHLAGVVEDDVKLNVVSIGNEINSTTSIITLPLKFGEDILSFTGKVTDRLEFLTKYFMSTYKLDGRIDALIGSDSLKAYNATIEYENNSLTDGYIIFNDESA